MEKRLGFCGTSLDDLRAFPPAAKHEAGYQLDKVQHGQEPNNWKPMSSVGVSVKEIRIKDEGDIYRVMYIATFPEAVYVLHCFQKKTEKTSPADLKLAKDRYKALKRGDRP